jgi:hypothetical protein
MTLYGPQHNNYPKNRKGGNINNPTGSAEKLKKLWAIGSPDRERLLQCLAKRDMGKRALRAIYKKFLDAL